MPIHEEIQELIPAYVLGAADAEEVSRVRGHVTACEQCARVLDEYRDIASQLAYAAPSVEPPQDLKARTLRRAYRGDGGADRPLPAPRRRPLQQDESSRPMQAWWHRLGFAPLLAAASALIAIAALGFAFWQTDRLNREFAMQRDLMTVIAYEEGNVITVRGTDAAPQAIGKLYVDPDSHVAALVTVNLPAIQPDQVYRVWLTEPNGQHVAVGTINTDPRGNGWLLVRAPQDLEVYARVWVTTELRTGSTTPTGTIVLAAELASQ
jgi:anti-sigma-K factor RskA